MSLAQRIDDERFRSVAEREPGEGARREGPDRVSVSDRLATNYNAKTASIAQVRLQGPNYYSVREYADQRSAPNAAARLRVASVARFPGRVPAVQWFWLLTGASPAPPGCAIPRGAAV